MSPWQVFWAPEFHFPFGGSVAQRIEPTTSWFFGSIRPSAGDAELEQQAFAVASYGRQLGLITELLLDLTAQTSPGTAEGRAAAHRLKEIKTEIDKLKLHSVDTMTADVESLFGRISSANRGKARELSQKLSAKLNEQEI